MCYLTLASLEQVRVLRSPYVSEPQAASQRTKGWLLACLDLCIMILFPLPLPLFTPIIIIIIVAVVGRCAACAAVNDAVPFAFSFGFAAEEVVVVAVTVDYWPPLGFWRRRGFGVHGPGMARCCGTSSPSPAKGTWCHDCCYATLALRLGGCHASRAAPRWLPLRGAAQRRPGAGAGDQAQAEALVSEASWLAAVGGVN